MQYRPLGHTGLVVSPLWLGAMMFGAAGNPDHHAAIEIIYRALDAGINAIDTADVYSGGESETIVGKALTGGRRDGIVLATKFGLPFDDDPDHRGASRRWIFQSVEGSLRRLGTDWIDLYQVHHPDPAVDIDETLGALSDLVRQGKIRAFGASSVPASQIVEAQWAAERSGQERYRTEQPPYSLLARQIEIDVLPTCLRYGMGVLTYSPLAMRWLSGRLRKSGDASGSSRAPRFPGRSDLEVNQRKLKAADALGTLAEEAGLTPVEMAIAFLIRHPAVTSTIIAPSTLEHLYAQLPAADLELSSDVLDRIDGIVPPGVTLDQNDNMAFSSVFDAVVRRR